MTHPQKNAFFACSERSTIHSVAVYLPTIFTKRMEKRKEGIVGPGIILLTIKHQSLARQLLHCWKAGCYWYLVLRYICHNFPQDCQNSYDVHLHHNHHRHDRRKIVASFAGWQDN
jgi:hypothetical protein